MNHPSPESLSQVSSVRFELGSLDSRLTDTAKVIRQDLDQVKQEMETVVLKEMRTQLEEAYRRVGQEEAARKLVRDSMILHYVCMGTMFNHGAVDHGGC